MVARAVQQAALLIATVVAGLVGLVLIYGFGAGYYGSFHVASPWNVLVSVSLVVGLGLLLSRAIRLIQSRSETDVPGG